MRDLWVYLCNMYLGCNISATTCVISATTPHDGIASCASSPPFIAHLLVAHLTTWHIPLLIHIQLVPWQVDIRISLVVTRYRGRTSHRDKYIFEYHSFEYDSLSASMITCPRHMTRYRDTTSHVTSTYSKMTRCPCTISCPRHDTMSCPRHDTMSCPRHDTLWGVR